jgi:hypothetical protein
MKKVYIITYQDEYGETVNEFSLEQTSIFYKTILVTDAEWEAYETAQGLEEKWAELAVREKEQESH